MTRREYATMQRGVYQALGMQLRARWEALCDDSEYDAVAIVVHEALAFQAERTALLYDMQLLTMDHEEGR